MYPEMVSTGWLAPLIVAGCSVELAILTDIHPMSGSMSRAEIAAKGRDWQERTLAVAGVRPLSPHRPSSPVPGASAQRRPECVQDTSRSSIMLEAHKR